jgi:hypothetical protein
MGADVGMCNLLGFMGRNKDARREAGCEVWRKKVFTKSILYAARDIPYSFPTSPEIFVDKASTIAVCIDDATVQRKKDVSEN